MLAAADRLAPKPPDSTPSLLEKYNVNIADKYKPYDSIKHMLPGVPEGIVMLNICWELYGTGTIDRVPYFDEHLTHMVEPHAANVRPQDSAVEEYVELLGKYGVSAGCRGEPWAV
jgi:hypothetical protein